MLPLIAAALMAPEVLTLSRGISLPNQNLRYWAVTDTTLDGANPTTPAGGDYELSGGPSRMILIRFGDLDRAIGHRKVVSARLILHVSDGAPALRSVMQVKAPWGEGPVRRPSFMKPAVGESAEPRGAATWRSRLSGLADWQLQGANGTEDSAPIQGAQQVKLADDEIAIDGLGATVSEMAARWYENFGFALQFETSVMFESSQAPFDRPRLEVTLEDAAPVTGANLAVEPIVVKDAGDNWEVQAKVKNLGDAKSGGFRAVWLTQTRGGVMSENSGLAPNEEATFSNRISKAEKEARFASLSLRIYPGGPDADPSDNQAECFLGGIPVEVPAENWQVGARAARFVNETLFGQSRFSFAREGVLRRVNPVLGTAPSGFEELVKAMAIKAGAPDLHSKDAASAPYAEGLLGGETRCDAILFPQISLPSEPYFTPLLDNSGLEPTDLLGMTQVAVLNGLALAPPKIVMLRPTNRMGQAMQAVQLTFIKVGETAAAATVPPATTEAVEFPPALVAGDLMHTVYRVVGEKNGVRSETYLYGWQLLDASARGSEMATVLDLPLDLPNFEMGDSNLVEGKQVTDSAQRSSDALAVLTKSGNTSPITFSGKRGTWVEIDLGRDRAVAEVALISKNLPRSLDIFTYETGQQVDQALLWDREPDAKWRLEHRSADSGLVIRPSSGQFRFLRIVSRFDQADWELSEIRVRNAKVTP